MRRLVCLGVYVLACGCRPGPNAGRLHTAEIHGTPPTSTECPAPPPAEQMAGWNAGAWARACLARVGEAEQDLDAAVATAREQKDLIVVTCLDERLAPLRNLRAGIAAEADGIASTPPDVSARAQRLKQAYDRAGALFVEAEGCASRELSEGSPG